MSRSIFFQTCALSHRAQVFIQSHMPLHVAEADLSTFVACCQSYAWHPSRSWGGMRLQHTYRRVQHTDVYYYIHLHPYILLLRTVVVLYHFRLHIYFVRVARGPIGLSGDTT